MPDDPADLRERVRDLEQTADELRETVNQQSETIQKLMPSRRAVMAGLVGAGAGAAGVYHGTDPASAQAAGQVGTSSNPVDVFAYDLDVQSDADLNGGDLTDVGALNADEATIGNRQIPRLDSNGDVSDSGSPVTVSLNNAYDMIFVRATKINTNNSGTTGEDVELQIDGQTTSNYTTHRVSGSSTTDHYVLGEGNEFASGRLAGNFAIFTAPNNYTLQNGLISGETTDPVLGGVLQTSESPIGSITLDAPSGVDVEAELFGANY